MENKKFDKITIIMGAVSFVLAFLCLPIESIALSAVTLVLCRRRKTVYLEKIPTVFAVGAMIIAVIMLAVFFCFSRMQGFAAVDYWFIGLFFDIPV